MNGSSTKTSARRSRTRIARLPFGNAARATTTVCSGISGNPTGRIDIRTASRTTRQEGDPANDHRRPGLTPAANCAAESGAGPTLSWRVLPAPLLSRMIDNLPIPYGPGVTLTLGGHSVRQPTVVRPPFWGTRMRALRILLILVVIFGGLFVIADRVAVNFAEGEVADKLKTSENLDTTPDVSIKGFPFLTQVVGGALDDVQVGIADYEADTGTDGGTIRIDDLEANMKGVEFSGDYSSATASTATGTASVTYAELLKAAKSEPTQVAPGVTANIVGLSDGGNGKIKVAVEATVFGTKLPKPVDVLSTVTAKGDTVRVHADNLPSFGGVDLAENRVRAITDFEQKIEGLPGGIQLDKVQAAKSGVEITVKGSNVKLAG
ncbi:hypothetical protein SALBM311S_10617 [Streptomyces alboniger]